MGRQPCCDKVGLKKGPWTGDEDRKLANFILTHGQFCWRSVPKLSGLLRCGKSCRLRWINYLRPDLKRGLLSESEEKLVIDLHAQLGNRWSKIASHMPGRTDNEIKNQWNTHIKKKLREMGIDPLTHQPLLPPPPPHEQESCSKDISTIEQDPVLMNINVPLESATEATSSISSSSSSTILDNGLQLAITQVANQLDVTDYHNVEQVLTYDDGFCLEDVLLVEPPEIITNDCGNNNNIDINLEFSPPANLSSSSSKGTNNLADDSANTNGGNDNTTLEAAEHERWWAPKLPTKEDQLMGLWADDDLGCWDLEVNDEFNCEIEMIAASLRSCLDDDDYSSRTCK